MSVQRYDLIVGREYGEGKTAWTKIGAAFPAKGGGFSLTFDALPITGKDGSCRVLMREPLPKDGEPARKVTTGKAIDPIDDEISF